MKQYLFFGMCLIASPALAETCTFTLECYEGEACADTSYEIEIDLDNAQLITPSGNIAVNIGGSPTLNVFAGFTQSAFHTMTRAKEGEARYSVHLFDGPQMVNYMGSCN
ncbi:MAG: hypothetical protein OXC60_16605 [Litoreibacter sp.]|nr:hypothetical protein [Litoreibacter sp.]MCY4336277.1 hypothetical protein [Litoreibacter sp.]